MISTSTTAEDCGVPARELLRFAAGEARGAERRRILEHLLSGCGRCREALSALRELGDESARDEAPAAEDAPSISRILASLGERAARIERERTEARRHLEDFLTHPVARQWTLVRNSRRFDTWSFCAGLLDAAFEAIYDDPRRSREMADMALEIAERLDSAPYGERAVHDLRGRSWAHVGNARRALGDLAAAETALRRARALLDDGTGDPLDEAELLYFESSLYRAQRRFPEALRKVRRSIRLYRELGDSHLEGRSRLGEAGILYVQGEPLAAIEADRKGIALVDAERDRHLALAGRHNLVWHSMEAGRVDEALAELAEFRDEYARVGDRSSLLRLSWLEAKLLQKKGRREEARAAYGRTLDGFAAAELPYEVANVSLDLASLEVEAGRIADVKQLAAETLVLFRALGVAREQIAAWMVFQQAAEAEAVTGALIERLARYYGEARLRPDLRFDS